MIKAELLLYRLSHSLAMCYTKLPESYIQHKAPFPLWLKWLFSVDDPSNINVYGKDIIVRQGFLVCQKILYVSTLDYIEKERNYIVLQLMPQ